MPQSTNVVIVSGVRTAIGTFGGSLKDMTPGELGARCVREAVKRANVDPNEVESCIFGQVMPTGSDDAYVARTAALSGGLPVSTPALTVNRLCGSGVQSIVSTAQQIMLGDIKVGVSGGTESMSRVPYVVHAARWGQKMGDIKMIDNLLATLHDPYGSGHMGITAENVAMKYQITRDDQDTFALQSHQRAAKAREAGYFKDQILPIELESRKGKIVFDSDEHIRPETTKEGLSGLKPAFKKDGGTVTPGNASGINDGAAAVIVMSEAEASRRGAKPLARIVGYAHAAVEPNVMGIGPIPAVQNVMKKTGLKVADMDVIESNEAFAAQAIAVLRDLGFPAEKTNPNGGAIALGHPVGATGTILTVKTMYELKRTGKKYGLVTMCIGGGQGIALVLENLH